MARTSYILAGVLTIFVIVLVVTTLRTTTSQAGLAPEHRLAALEECQSTVLEEVPDGRFPFTPDVSETGAGGLLLAGFVDSGDGVQAVRRNYECYLRERTGPGTYATDSLEVWQSH